MLGEIKIETWFFFSIILRVHELFSTYFFIDNNFLDSSSFYGFIVDEILCLHFFQETNMFIAKGALFPSNIQVVDINGFLLLVTKLLQFF